MRQDRGEAARLARVARYLGTRPMSQAECFRPAAEAMDAARAIGEEREIDRSRWSLNAADDGPAPRVTHDSGWFRWVRGQPLPPIKAFEVSDQ